MIGENLENFNKVKVVILIPIHNGVEETLRCVESIYNSTYSNFDIIVIDDGSVDNSQTIISSAFKEVKFLKGNGDLWWSGGMNEGIRYTLNEYNKNDIVLLLNNDNIIQNDMIEVLVKSIESNPNSIICSKVYIEGAEDQLLFAGGSARIRKGGLFIEGYYEADKGNFNKLKEVDWCGGMGVAIPIPIIKNIGYFDNINFPQYFGDADYMYRAKRKGIKILYNPSSVCWNDRGQTGFSVGRSKVNLKVLRNLFFNIKSNYDLKANIKFYIKYFGYIKGSSMLAVKYTTLSLSLIKKSLFYSKTKMS
ncbi:glycosyl transferase domain-containing protein [Priestia megaterium]|uniref:glycosyltransferase family 2 protein n=1 Tax=Priestia megaterium TaxID=1404 RepID=UPI000E1A57D5|nr:glycosyltransferase family 2 protein [Priestia megaterium]SUV02262.1 glycosyl transferase domain-containing protein [Priestia megaterium]